MADRQLFMRTLRQLHDQLGTQFRIPMVSGRELDIHLLYKQVRCSAGSKHGASRLGLSLLREGQAMSAQQHGAVKNSVGAVTRSVCDSLLKL